jgi:hypothetical protein
MTLVMIERLCDGPTCVILTTRCSASVRKQSPRGKSHSQFHAEAQHNNPSRCIDADHPVCACLSPAWYRQVAQAIDYQRQAGRVCHFANSICLLWPLGMATTRQSLIIIAGCTSLHIRIACSSCVYCSGRRFSETCQRLICARPSAAP